MPTKPSSENPEAEPALDGPSALRTLARDTSNQWFIDLAELAIAYPNGQFDEKLVADLFKSFESGEKIDHWLTTPLPQKTEAEKEAEPPEDEAAEPPRVCFEQIGPFENFRKLGPSLTLSPKQHFTVVFGTNGSGKSSVCLALRCLARRDAPSTLLPNIKRPNEPPKFTYRLAASDSDEQWSGSNGYGSHYSEVAYFDGRVAHDLVNHPAKLEQAVEVAPLGLESFTIAGRLLTELDRACANELTQRSTAELEAFAALKKACKDLAFLSAKSEPLEQERWLRALAPTEVTWDEDKDSKSLEGAERQLKELQDHRQPNKISLLEAQLQTLKSSRQVVRVQSARLKTLSTIDEKAIAAKRTSDTATRNGLLQAVLTSDEAEDAFLDLLKQADVIAPFAEKSESCPLCKQSLDEDAAKLFEQYRSLLSETILAEIEAANKNLAKYKKGRNDILIKIEDWRADNLKQWLPDQDSAGTNDIADRIRSALGAEEGQFEATAQFKVDVRQSRRMAAHLLRLISTTAKSIEQIGEGEEVIENKITEQTKTVRALKLRQFQSSQASAISDYADAKSSHVKLESKRNGAAWQDKRTKLTQKLGAITEQLVKDGFEQALDAEYQAITSGLGMNDFGVSIRMNRAEQKILLLPKIGGSDLSEVLSEGEQRLHAIAMFFAEAMVRKPHVMVFDDPSVSFDYNYVDGVVERIIAYAMANNDCQILVYTHNWEFFSKLEAAIGKLNEASAQSYSKTCLELQHCGTTEPHTESIDNRKQKVIQKINGLDDQVSRDDTEASCLQIRLLIEDIVNKYVFNGQRQAFKSRPATSMAVHKFTEVWPLTPEQAVTLSNLASRASDWMHRQSGGGSPAIPNKTQLWDMFNKTCAVHDELHTQRQARKTKAAGSA